MWLRPGPKIGPWVALFVAIFISQTSAGLYTFDGALEYEWEILFKTDPAYISTLRAIQKDRPGPEEGHDWNFSMSETSFSCSLPIVGEKADSKEEKKQDPPSIQQILEPLLTQCMFHKEVWWTYEFCYGRHMRQYHAEQEQVQDEYMLGMAPQQADGLEEDTYYKEEYEGGTFCVISNKRRSATIQFRCNPSLKQHIIGSIKEPSSCTYIIEIQTPLLCQHPRYDIPLVQSEKIYCFEQPLPSDLDQTPGAIPSTPPRDPFNDPELTAAPKQQPTTNKPKNPLQDGLASVLKKLQKGVDAGDADGTPIILQVIDQRTNTITEKRITSESDLLEILGEEPGEGDTEEEEPEKQEL